MLSRMRGGGSRRRLGDIVRRCLRYHYTGLVELEHFQGGCMLVRYGWAFHDTMSGFGGGDVGGALHWGGAEGLGYDIYTHYSGGTEYIAHRHIQTQIQEQHWVGAHGSHCRVCVEGFEREDQHRNAHRRCLGGYSVPSHGYRRDVSSLPPVRKQSRNLVNCFLAQKCPGMLRQGGGAEHEEASCVPALNPLYRTAETDRPCGTPDADADPLHPFCGDVW